MNPRRRKTLRWLEAALRDLDEIVEQIGRESPRAAENFAEKVFSKVELLETSPHLGAVCPYYRKARQLVHGSHIIFYTVHREEIVIRAVVHGARLFRSEWLRRED